MKLKICFLVLSLLLTASPAMPQAGASKIMRSARTLRTRTSSWKTPKPPKPPKPPRVSTSGVSGYNSGNGLGSLILPGVGNAILNGDNDSDSKRHGVVPGAIIPGNTIGERRPIFTAPQPLGLCQLKDPIEMMDESMAKQYPDEKKLIDRGAFDKDPVMLFYWADFAKRKVSDEDALEIMNHIDPKTLTPAILYHFPKYFKAIQEYGPKLAYLLNARAYLQMAKAKYAGRDCDSARMQGGDTLLTVTGKYMPFLKPLTELSCFYDPAKEIERYKITADSLIANYGQLPPEFKAAFFTDFLATLHSAKEYHAALDYFEMEQLKSYPDSLADLSLRLAECAWGLGDNERFFRYLHKADEVDSASAQKYWEEVYNGQLETFIADPSQTSVADWLLENTDYPADDALSIALDVITRYFPASTDNKWDWPDSTTYSPDQLAARDGIIYVLDHIANLDTSDANTYTLKHIDYLKASYIGTIDDRTEEALEITDRLCRELEAASSEETDEFHCCLVFTQAYMTGHGLDKPKEALKILKKNTKLLKAPGISDDTRYDWYDYMAALSSRLGKTKDAEKYLKLRESVNSPR